jgi:DGQHR domain-containing protein
MKLILTAFPVKQGDITFYLTSLTAGALVDETYFRIDRWNPASKEGYQREINSTHAHRLGRYLGRSHEEAGDLQGREYASAGPKTNNNNMLPSAVVINFRKPLVIDSQASGAVEITLDQWPGYIIDGQHRIEGAREQINAGNDDMIDYAFPVTLTNLSLEDEMTQFRNLNTTANRPPRGLNQAIAHSLYKQYGRIPMTWGEQAQIRTTDITMKLASETTSPWYGLIALGGIRKRSNHSTVQAQFSESIQPLFTTGRFSQPEQKLEEAYQLILNYWKAIEEVWPDAATSESSILFRPKGYWPLNKVLGHIFNSIALNPTKEDFVEILEAIKDKTGVEDEDWAKDGRIDTLTQGYSTNKGYTLISDYLWRGVDDALKTKIRTKMVK